ncbi:farnesyl pyrophosphate synthetase [Tubulinosema ratisbonensis]|uniref:Farnesyl pyrophosphate synthetase n=1 Tax=Tubulinosema ratisbonensis TaxID=291195 RepID=A0A437AQH7_9MICR|nr:farnesyl pyrophosphate synthetase [Tubulinosema ratisbonensis]
MEVDLTLFKEELISLFFKNLNLKRTNYITEVLEYNTWDGKLTRASLTYSVLKKLGDISLNDLFLCYLNEIIQGSFIIFDDIMDQSELRRNKPCWHKVKGNKVIKDGYFLLSCVRKLLPSNKIIRLYDKMFFRSCLGQTHDSLSELSNFNDLCQLKNFYEMKNYKLICLNKNAFYTFYFPIKMGLLHRKISNLPNLFMVCKLLGELHQMQDDYLNFLPNTNKSCLDVKQRKNTWFMCKYFEKEEGNEFYDDILLEEKLREYINEYFKEEERLIDVISEIKVHLIGDVIQKCLLLMNKRKK